MKKISILAVFAVVASMFVGCGNSTPKAEFKNEVDTLSYAIGVSNSQGLDQYLMNIGVDSAYMDQFYKGMVDGLNSVDDKKLYAYYTGIAISNQVYNNIIRQVNSQLSGDDSTKVLNSKNVLAGMLDGLKKKTKMTQEMAWGLQQSLGKAVQQKMIEKKYGDNKKKGEQYLAKNKQAKDVVTLPSGVQYKVIKEGAGSIPADNQVITIHYEGKLIDGTVFDSSYERGEPLTGRANQFVPGFTEALLKMPAGSKWEVTIPQQLGYRDQHMGDIPPYSTLIFTIELVSVAE